MGCDQVILKGRSLLLTFLPSLFICSGTEHSLEDIIFVDIIMLTWEKVVRILSTRFHFLSEIVGAMASTSTTHNFYSPGVSSRCQNLTTAFLSFHSI